MNSQRILIIDNNINRISWGAGELMAYARKQLNAEITVRRAPQRDWPQDLLQYSHIVISGSLTAALDEAPWIDELDRAILKWMDRGTPVLGVCYGHQSIVRALSGRKALRRAPVGEFGWTRIEQVSNALGPSPLFAGLPSVFHSYSSHYDEVVELPESLVHDARSERCSIQSFRHRTQPVFGIQFHPERTLLKGTTDLEAKIKRSEIEHLVTADPKLGTQLYRAEVADRIFGNFFALGRI